MTTPNVVQGDAVAVSTDNIRNSRVRDIIQALPNTGKWLSAKGVDELMEFMATDYAYRNAPKASFDIELLAFRQFAAGHALAKRMPEILNIIDFELTEFFGQQRNLVVSSGM